jgi:hypothetical protein
MVATDRRWWPRVSTMLLVLFFVRWYVFILVINIALIVGIAWMDWPSFEP